MCRCDCGTERTVTANNLLNGNSASCGCLQRDVMSEMNTVHGATVARAGKVDDPDSARLYTIWLGIKDRCTREKNPAWHRYGGRGITICDEWKNSFPAFKSWALEHHYAAGLECDRIDPDADYSPVNCRWVTKRKNIEHMRKAWDGDLDQRLIAEAKRRGQGPYELITEAVRFYLDSSGLPV
jgi:hypothetical protein